MTSRYRCIGSGLPILVSSGQGFIVEKLKVELVYYRSVFSIAEWSVPIPTNSRYRRHPSKLGQFGLDFDPDKLFFIAKFMMHKGS